MTTPTRDYIIALSTLRTSIFGIKLEKITLHSECLWLLLIIRLTALKFKLDIFRRWKIEGVRSGVLLRTKIMRLGDEKYARISHWLVSALGRYFHARFMSLTHRFLDYSPQFPRKTIFFLFLKKKFEIKCFRKSEWKFSCSNVVLKL